MTRGICLRELRNDSGAILRAVEAGEDFVVTRNGTALAELRPPRRRRLVAKAELLTAARQLAPIDAAAFRSDVDQIVDQGLEREHAPTVAGMHPRDVLARAARDPDAVDRYAPGPDHVIDLYLPSGNEPASVIVLAHGGYWQFDRRPCRLLAGALADDGFIVVLPEYRLTGGGGGWPQSYRDIRAAMNHLPELLAKLARPGPVDIVLMGHSAGGHMAMWLVRRADLRAEITRVVALAPAADLRSMYERHLNDAAMIALMAGSPDQVPDRYAAADALTGSASDVPITVLHGTDDEVIPVEMSRALNGVEYRELLGIGHFDIIDPRTPAYPAVLAAVRGDSVC